MLRPPTLLIYNLDHLNDFTLVSPSALYTALADSHLHCGEGFASNDRGSANRSFTLSRMDGLLTGFGPVATLPVGPTRPVATTWIAVPTEHGEEAIMVNCVKPLGGNRWRLVRGDAGAVPDFLSQPTLLGDPNALEHFMLGIVWTGTRRARGEPYIMRATVMLLGGHLDCDARIFHARDARELMRGTFGGGNAGGNVPPANGPTPPLVSA